MIRELHPDVLVMATGAQPLVPEIKGIHDTGVVLANDVLLGSPVLKSSGSYYRRRRSGSGDSRVRHRLLYESKYCGNASGTCGEALSDGAQ